MGNNEDIPGSDRRTTGARIGASALNLIQPGLGLLRVGQGRIGGLLIVSPFLWLTASIALFAVTSPPSFPAVVVYGGTALTLTLVLYVSAIILTWRRSVALARPIAWWSRWYALVGFVIAAGILSEVAVAQAHRFYKPFYIPSENMAPTLGKLDRIIADMRGGRHPAVGDIVLIKICPTTYIKRVVALPGDRIAMAADIPIINGVRARTREVGPVRFLGIHGVETATLVREQLPREIGSHEIALTGYTDYGDLPEHVVPPGHIFVLGDNRERSADSRLPRAEDGLGMVGFANVVGQPMYVTWPHDHRRIGRSAAH